MNWLEDAAKKAEANLRSLDDKYLSPAARLLLGGPEMTTTTDTHQAMRVAAPLPGWMFWILRRFYWHRVWWVVMVPEDGIYQTVKVEPPKP